MKRTPSERARSGKFTADELASIEARFLPKVKKSEGCWEWTAYRMPNGYGRLGMLGGEVWMAHRVAYLLHHGELKPGTLVLHHCDNPPCVRPDHLYLGSAADNMRDRSQRGRSAAVSGASHANARLTDDDVRDIRARAAVGESKASISKSYPVSRQVVSDIVHRKMWRSVE